MVNKIDRSLEDVGLFRYYTDSNCCYILEMKKNSDICFINLFKEYGKPNSDEVFSIFKTLSDLCNEYSDKHNIEKGLAIIDASSDEERRKKTIAFTRYIKDSWEYKILVNPDFRITGRKISNTINTNCILITKKSENKDYCLNCGSKNENYKFCPNCGFKIKED
jgi:hypothetical protein